MEFKDKFTLKDEYGNETEYDVLLTFDNEETDKSYVVYTDHSQDEDGNIQVFANSYVKGSTSLDPIETDREWDIIDKILETIQEEVKNQTENNQE